MSSPSGRQRLQLLLSSRPRETFFVLIDIYKTPRVSDLQAQISREHRVFVKRLYVVTDAELGGRSELIGTQELNGLLLPTDQLFAECSDAGNIGVPSSPRATPRSRVLDDGFIGGQASAEAMAEYRDYVGIVLFPPSPSPSSSPRRPRPTTPSSPPPSSRRTRGSSSSSPSKKNASASSDSRRVRVVSDALDTKAALDPLQRHNVLSRCRARIREIEKELRDRVAAGKLPHDILIALCKSGRKVARPEEQFKGIFGWCSRNGGQQQEQEQEQGSEKSQTREGINEKLHRELIYIALKIHTLLRLYPQIDVNKYDTDGNSPAFFAAMHCNEPEKLVGKRLVQPNHCLATLVHHGARFIHPDDAKLTSSQKLFVYCYFIFAAGLYVMCFLLIITYSSLHFELTDTCDTMYNIVLQPYGVIILNIIFFKVFQSTFTQVGNFIFYIYFSVSHAAMAELYSASLDDPLFFYSNIFEAQGRPRLQVSAGSAGGLIEAGSKRSLTELEAAEEDARKIRQMFVMQQYSAAWRNDPRYVGGDFFTTPPYQFLLIQFVSSFVSLILACVKIRAESAFLSPWQQYSKLFGILVNSSVPLTFFSIIRMMAGSPWGEGRWTTQVSRTSNVSATNFVVLPGVFFFVLLVAVLLTHIIPAAIVYCWLVLLVVLVVLAVLALCALFLVPVSALAALTEACRKLTRSALEAKGSKEKEKGDEADTAAKAKEARDKASHSESGTAGQQASASTSASSAAGAAAGAAAAAAAAAAAEAGAAASISASISALAAAQINRIHTTASDLSGIYRTFLSNNPAIEYLVAIAAEVVLRIAFVFFYQTLYNYAYLMYSYPTPIGGSEYLEVIAADYHLRSQTLCYFRQIQDASSRGGTTGYIIVLSWL